MHTRGGDYTRVCEYRYRSRCIWKDHHTIQTQVGGGGHHYSHNRYGILECIRRKPSITLYTVGFNVETVDYNNVRWTAWDLGGRDKTVS